GRARLGIAALLVGLLAVAGAAAHPGSAATTTITITAAQSPSATDAATLSTTGQTTYVFYSLRVESKSSWTHVILSDSAPVVTPTGSGAAVVFTDCPGATIDTSGGFSCNIDKLSPNTPQTFDVVVRTPTSGAMLTVNPT